MTWKTKSYQVIIPTSYEVPVSILESIVLNASGCDAPSGYRKIEAIKRLREWFRQTHGEKLDLRDSKELIEVAIACYQQEK